jgi:hypothetical protein
MIARRARFIVLLAFACAIAAGGSLSEAGDYKPATRGEPEKKFVVQPGGLLSFDADLAHGQVETGDYESVRVEFQSYYKVDTAEEVEALYDKLSVEMAQNGNTVKVVVRFADPDQATRDKVRLNFKVAIPRKFNLDMRTGGDARIDDIDGTVKVSSDSGSLTLENVTGSVKASTKHGSLTIRDVGGDLEARCEGGSTSIGKVGGRVVTSSAGGSLSIKDAGEAVDATVKAGSVTATFAKSPRSDCKITADDGGIDLRLPASAAVTIDAACIGGGGVTTDFENLTKVRGNTREIKGNINGGGPVILLRTKPGSIQLRKEGA